MSPFLSLLFWGFRIQADLSRLSDEYKARVGIDGRKYLNTQAPNFKFDTLKNTTSAF
jgi:hypothetical protein